MPLYIIGLDGATWDLLNPLMAGGHLPHLQDLIRQGARAPLLSTWPPVTALAWPSFYTGQNAGKHGVFSFVRLDAEGRERVVDARWVAAPALWDWASAAGLRVGVMGVPVTYPAQAVNGFMISDFLTPPGAADAFYPPDLRTRLEARSGPWTFHVPPIEGQPTVADTRSFITQLTGVAGRQFDALQTLLDEQRPDLFAGVWMHTDTIQHGYWGYLHPDHAFFARPEAPALRELILPAFHQLDEFLGALAARVLPDGDILIISDHGFGPLHRRLALNNALARHGYLSLRQGRVLADRIQRRLRRQFGLNLAQPDDMRHVKRHAGQGDYIDWSHTRAFAGALHELCIHLHRTDRYPNGIVRPADAPALLADLTDMLLGLRDADGQPLLAEVYRPEQLYHGPCLDHAPDLLLRPFHPGDIVTDGLLRGGRLWRSEAESAGGWHRGEGILVAAGRSIRQGTALSRPPSLLDVAPTALRLLGFSAPAVMDGRVLDELLAPNAGPLHALPDLADKRRTQAGEMSEADDAALAKRLKGLGYLA